MAVLSQLYVDVIARGFADVNRQVNSLMQSMRNANALSNQMGRTTGGSGAMGAGMAQAAGSAGMMSRALAAIGPALVAAGIAVAGLAAGWKLVTDGMQGTTELYRVQFAYQQFARSVAGVFAPVFNQMTQAWQNINKTFGESSSLRAGLYIGMVVPMQLFVKGMEVAVRLAFTFTDTMLKFVAAFARINVGGGFGDLLDKLRKAGEKKNEVTLNQTGQESGQGTFARIQEAILKLSVPEAEDPLKEVMQAIDAKVAEIEKIMKNAGNVANVNPQAIVNVAAMPANTIIGAIRGGANRVLDMLGVP
jgi:hypothetical protein